MDSDTTQGRILDGKALAARVGDEVRAGVAAFKAEHGRAPGLTVVLVGDDPASRVYVGRKEKTSREVGMEGRTILLPSATSRADLLAQLAALAADDATDGILLQLPLPAHLDSDEMLAAIEPSKDVDGFHPLSQGHLLSGKSTFVPCTPRGMMRMLDETRIELAGQRAVVVGRSNIVGKPIALLLLARNATVTICHSRTKDLAGEVKSADIVVAAIGRPEFIKGNWIKPGAIVLDVGINRMDDGKLKGDVEFAAARARASWITPVPGGVGPMTVACLLENTLQAARQRVARAT